jgi:hypothetical protein
MYLNLKVRFYTITFFNKIAHKITHKVASKTNVAHFCHFRQSEVCSKPNKFAANSLR